MWNVRGLNSSRRQALTKDWINIHKPLFGAFIETHIHPTNTGRIISAIPAGWKFFGNFEHHSTARVIVVWDPSVSLVVYKVSAQLITCGIFLQAHNISFTVSFAYGFNRPEERQPLWEELIWLNTNTPVQSHPWAVAGDFNQILRLSHHSHHLTQSVDTTGIENINLALQDAALFEAQANGLPFTWWDNHEVNPTAKKIDHAFINQSWADAFSDSYAEFLEPLQSDHAACLVQVPSVHRSVRKPFKFFQHVVEHQEYKESVDQNWKPQDIQGTYQFKLVRSLKLLKPVLRSLNKRHFSGITARVKEQETRVTTLQSEVLTNPTEIVIREEHQARAKWQFLLSAEERFFRQKSRVNWMHLGDKNTSFFHRSASQRAAQNHIHFLRDADDRKLVTSSEIKAHAADYFQGIIRSTTMPISPVSISTLQELLPFRCSDAQRTALQKTVTEEEVKATLFAMPQNKSPGPDGYSVEFFKASWDTVGNDVTKAVKEFFSNGRLLRELNTTAIALIPKQPKVCTLGDYRPISCCNLIYKVISKIIALRLKPILQDCISPNQAAFLKGRSLGENVLLASELIRNYHKPSCPKSCMLKLDIRKAFDTVC